MENMEDKYNKYKKVDVQELVNDELYRLRLEIESHLEGIQAAQNLAFKLIDEMHGLFRDEGPCLIEMTRFIIISEEEATEFQVLREKYNEERGHSDSDEQ